MNDENTKAVDEKVAEDEKEKQESILINEETIQSKIYVVRGQKVMLDADLAEIYGYETKNFNRQVKNNKAKFEGDDFMFQLTKDEWENLRCKNFTSSWGGSRNENNFKLSKMSNFKVQKLHLKQRRRKRETGENAGRLGEELLWSIF